MNSVIWIENQRSILYKDFIFNLNEKKLNHPSLPNYSNFIKIIKEVADNKKFSDIDSLLENLIENKESNFELFTSGSTGKPKKVKVVLRNCLRMVKTNKSSVIWGLAYPSNSFAGTQVFFQSLFNKQTIVSLNHQDFKTATKLIEDYKVTNLTCTPTYLKMLTSGKTISMRLLKNISLGGETLSLKNYNYFKKKFPKTTIRNIYASSEVGSILVTKGECFYIPNDLKGKVKIVNEELLFHKTLLNDFTNQKLIDNWYYSGDIIEWIDKKHFIIVNRNSNYINVGGHRVNLIEVEETLLGINQIREARVFSKSNSILGNIIGVEYKGEIDSRNLHILLRGLLESHKVPTILKKVDQIPLTQTGKKKRI